MEIGSDFWEYTDSLNSDNSDFWNIGKETVFTLSGRTAIYYCLENIMTKKEIKKAYVPSYCCDSMIRPFIDLGVDVEYYDVYNNYGLKYNIEYRDDVDLFLAMNYFGYVNTNMDQYIKRFKDYGVVVIEDITHSAFSTKRYSEHSDYLIGSLRKWMPILSGGIAVSMNSMFDIRIDDRTNEKMIEIKGSAMSHKKEYIHSEEEKLKDVFLSEYKRSNVELEDNYKNFSMDEKSLQIIQKIDIAQIKNKRIENAKEIYEKLKGKVDFLIEDYNGEDALLAVPIMLDSDKRDALRNYLKDKKVYLPVHWPLPDERNTIFDRELSLVCDQRYTKEQVAEYVDYIIDFLNNAK